MSFPPTRLQLGLITMAVTLTGFFGPASAADRALLIGIGHYQNLPDIVVLNGPKNDVRAIDELLTGTLGFAPDNVKTLVDDQATRDGILRAIDDWLIKGTHPGDRAYLYFSGRGLQVADDNGDEEDQLDEALSTYDIVKGDKDWSGAIRDDEIEAIAAQLKNRALTLVFDASYSGSVENAVAGDSEQVDGARFLPRPVLNPVETRKTRGLKIDLAVVDKPDALTESGATSWNAAASYQVALDDTKVAPDQQQGVFTAAYVAGHKAEVSDANKNGLVSNAELYEYVKTQSETYCAGQEGCKTLDPKLDVPAKALGASVSGSYQAPEKVVTDTDKMLKTEEIKVAAYEAPAYVDADPVSAVSDITGKTETGDVLVAIDRGTKLYTGDIFKISVTSKYDGHLILLDVNSKGVATQIFPNEFAQKITPLRANATLTMPDEFYGFDFEAEGSGESILVAIVVSDPVDLSLLVPKTRGLKVEMDARESLSDIVVRLQKTWTDDIENRGIKWSIGTLKYTIE